jgi:mRNA interferase HigB
VPLPGGGRIAAIDRASASASSGSAARFRVTQPKRSYSQPAVPPDQFANASICGNNRVVFNVGGNKYRLVVELQYRAGIAWVKFVGTHAQYDRIDVETAPRNGRTAVRPPGCVRQGRRV